MHILIWFMVLDKARQCGLVVHGEVVSNIP